MANPADPADQLSPDDAAILALESAAIAGHTMKVVVLEAADRELELERLRAAVGARVASEPRARQRLELDGGEWSWVADEGFDVGAQITRRESTRGIDEPGLWAAAGEVMSERLDHSRPLWALDLVGPLGDGREAIVARIHHALADGITSLRFLEALLWDAEAPSEAASGRPPPGPRSRSGFGETARLPGALARELGARASRSRLDREIGSRRCLVAVAMPLAELRAIGHSRPAPATVNDTLLATLAGGLHEWLGGDRRRARHLRAQVPVSLHRHDPDASDLGNRDSFLNVDLPLAQPDPLRRLDLIALETSRRKRLDDAEELYDFFHALARVPRLARVAERLAAGPREFSLSVSNVPGPPGAISVLGRRVQRLCTVAEPAMHHALRVSAISCNGTVAVSLCTDPEALPGVEQLAAAVDSSFEELRAAAIL